MGRDARFRDHLFRANPKGIFWRYLGPLQPPSEEIEERSSFLRLQELAEVAALDTDKNPWLNCLVGDAYARFAAVVAEQDHAQEASRPDDEGASDLCIESAVNRFANEHACRHGGGGQGYGGWKAAYKM